MHSTWCPAGSAAPQVVQGQARTLVKHSSTPLQHIQLFLPTSKFTISKCQNPRKGAKMGMSKNEGEGLMALRLVFLGLARIYVLLK